MTDRNDQQPPTESSPEPFGTDVGRLVKIAGPRPTMPEARLDRMQADLRPLWQTEVEKTSPAVSRSRSFAIAALLVIAIGAALIARTFLPAEAIVVASLERIDGSVSGWSGEGATPVELKLGTELRIGDSLATAPTSRVAIETATGHSLRLDRGTRLVFESERELRLEQGAVYLDSGVGETPPLSVLTALGRVEEIGTQFEVRLGADSLTVRVREGAVSFERNGEKHLGTAGQELTVSQGSIQQRDVAPTDALFGWTQTIAPSRTIDGRPLDEYLEWVARESGLTLVYSDPSIASSATSIRLSGEIEGLAPMSSLGVVLPAVGLASELDGGTLRIDRP